MAEYLLTETKKLSLIIYLGDRKSANFFSYLQKSYASCSVVNYLIDLQILSDMWIFPASKN